LYVAAGIKRQGTNLHLTLIHDPDNEGSSSDTQVPPEHQFYQSLTVDLPLTPEIRGFLCAVFTSGPTPSSFDASNPTFLTSVNYSNHTLLSADGGGTAQVSNLTDICGTSKLPAIQAPRVTPDGRPALIDVAMAIPLEPKPTGFIAGMTIHGWLARGVLYVDEESELVPQLSATVVTVQ
jgi:hypothetical protein